MSNRKELEELQMIQSNICIRMDYYAKKASDVLLQIEAFQTIEEPTTLTLAAIDYLKDRYDEIMAEFRHANEDLIRLKQLIKTLHPTENDTKRVQESMDGFISRIETEYSYQMFDSTTFDME